jgi:hypothetical protein
LRKNQSRNAKNKKSFKKTKKCSFFAIYKRAALWYTEIKNKYSFLKGDGHGGIEEAGAGNT